MKKPTRYTPTENGYFISASSDIFNRVLYGSHLNDDKPERFFTFAGDAPLIMGAVTDWTKNTTTPYAKCGVLSSGLAITPGGRQKFYYTYDIDITSRWFHNSEDIRAEYKNGWMEYELSQISSWFPDVKVNIETYPLLPEDGYLVHYTIESNQRVHLVAGFGGITEGKARFEYRDESKRHFTPDDCIGNTVDLGNNRACVTHTDGTTMRVATSFNADFSLGSAKYMSEPFPSTFLAEDCVDENDRVVRICAVIEPGKVFDGYIIAIRNTDDATLDKWLAMENPIGYIKQQIYAKHACIGVKTPERMLDLTIAPTVMALDASWHKDSFHHGAYAYHAPFLGWRNWYAPTALHWWDRVSKTIQAHMPSITRGDIADEYVLCDPTPVPKDDVSKQYPTKYGLVHNPVGRLSDFLGEDMYGPYNMQECALDMLLYYVEWSGDIAIVDKYFDDIISMLDWETRMFDADGDGLYENMLNTWISDGHCYCGGGCAQASAYNYRANAIMAKLARKLGRDDTLFKNRAEKIKRAINEKLWLAHEGVVAESIDTIGNLLIHPAIELSTPCLITDCDVVDEFKAYMTLRYTENHIKSVVTPGSAGRLSYSSDWRPKQYSNCGIFPAENAHLALVYFKTGLFKEGKKLLDGIKDCYFAGRNPAQAPHIQSNLCTSDFGDQDFTDVSSTYLRAVIEGLFGIRINSLDNVINIAPGFPEEWEDASLTLRDISLHYSRRGGCEVFDIACDREERKHIRIPMRSSGVEAVLLDGEPVSYEVVPAPNNSFLILDIDKVGRFQLRVMHTNTERPKISAPSTILVGNEVVFEICGGTPVEAYDISESLSDISIIGNKVYAKAKDIGGEHTLFIRVQNGEYNAWLAADYKIEAKTVIEEPVSKSNFVPIDISEYFNCNMTEVHDEKYISPKPLGYFMSVFQNGRYCKSWNQGGCLTININDDYLRNSGGIVYSPSRIPFATPKDDKNLACVSIWDNFPTEITIPVSGKGEEVAVMFVASTNCMQSWVENARITVNYADGTSTHTKLIYPLNIDDWLTSALTSKAEIFYLNNLNHATVVKTRVDPSKELLNIKIEAVANEVVLGVVGISINR